MINFKDTCDVNTSESDIEVDWRDILMDIDMCQKKASEKDTNMEARQRTTLNSQTSMNVNTLGFLNMSLRTVNETNVVHPSTIPVNILSHILNLVTIDHPGPRLQTYTNVEITGYNSPMLLNNANQGIMHSIVTAGFEAVPGHEYAIWFEVSGPVTIIHRVDVQAVGNAPLPNIPNLVPYAAPVVAAPIVAFPIIVTYQYSGQFDHILRIYNIKQPVILPLSFNVYNIEFRKLCRVCYDLVLGTGIIAWTRDNTIPAQAGGIRYRGLARFRSNLIEFSIEENLPASRFSVMIGMNHRGYTSAYLNRAHRAMIDFYELRA
ncbi:hypothetical protein AKO1_011069 [Acrasis kona]|uniref:Uncharacterized protein n=1 Tax=Acrasis kona TaxID=1008807 RepID=A0AAW2YTH0_9EUKA